MTPRSGSGKTIIDRCMTDESILQTPILPEIPNEHRPDDEWIAARLRVDHEFKKRVAAGVQRKFKRNFQGGMGTGYTTSDEVWCHFKPTEEQLEKWIHDEDRGENRLDPQSAMDGQGEATAHSSTSEFRTASKSKEGEAASQNDDEVQRGEKSGAKTASRSDEKSLRSTHKASSTTSQSEDTNNATTQASTAASVPSTDGATTDAPHGTWLGMLPALRDGPR